MPDSVATWSESEPQTKWLRDNKIETEKQVKIVKVAHMRYQHPDLQAITTFLRGELYSSLTCGFRVAYMPPNPLIPRKPGFFGRFHIAAFLQLLAWMWLTTLRNQLRLRHARREEDSHSKMVQGVRDRPVRVLCARRPEEILGWRVRSGKLRGA